MILLLDTKCVVSENIYYWRNFNIISLRMDIFHQSQQLSTDLRGLSSFRCWSSNTKCHFSSNDN